MELNNLEGISSWINSLTGGAKAGGLGDIGKLTGLLGTRGLSGIGLGNKFPIALILLLLVLFGNRGGYGSNPQQYACCCYKRKHRRHHRRCCCNESYGYGNQCCGYGGYGQGGYGGYGGVGGGSNIIFIIILLFLIQLGKRTYPLAESAAGNIFNFNAGDVLDTHDDYEYKDTDDEE